MSSALIYSKTILSRLLLVNLATHGPLLHPSCRPTALQHEPGHILVLQIREAMAGRIRHQERLPEEQSRFDQF